MTDLNMRESFEEWHLKYIPINYERKNRDWNDLKIAYSHINKYQREVDQLLKENEKLKKDVKEAVNTTWRFINAYENKNDVPVNMSLKSAKYHLEQIDYIFED